MKKYLKEGITNANYSNLQSCEIELTDVIFFSKNKYFQRFGDKLNK